MGNFNILISKVYREIDDMRIKPILKFHSKNIPRQTSLLVQCWHWSKWTSY